jgi:DNA-binding CsgD family transcriptional regulator
VSALYGRDPELRHFAATVERVAQNHSSSLVIEGEPGIGKSRLIDELTNMVDAKGWPVLVCRCGELDVDHPFVPILDGLEDLVRGPLGASIDIPSELITAIAMLRREGKGSKDGKGREDGKGSEGAEGGEQITTMIIEGLHDLARSGPVLVVFEDAHWIDEASARVLWRIARKRRNSSLLVAITHRPTQRPVVQAVRRGLDTQGITTLKLGPLRPEDANALAVEILGESSVPDAALLNDAGGNPLFVIELMRGAMQIRAGGTSSIDSTIPESLRRLVIGRYNELPPETRTTLFDAALLGQQIHLVELCAVRQASPDDIRRSLHAAVENHMLVENGTHLGFQHAIVQSIIAASQSGLAQRARHGEIAAHFAEAGASTTRVAEHLWLSHPDPTPVGLGPTVAWFRQAADSVIPLSLSSALSWNNRALAVCTTQTERFDVQLEIAALQILTGQLREAEFVCGSLDSMKASDEQLLRLRLTKASIATMQGPARYEEASQHISWAIHAMPDDDVRRAELLGFQAVLSVFSGELERAYEQAKEALSFPLKPSEYSLCSRAYEAVGIADLLRGDIASAQLHSQLATTSFGYDHRLFTSMMMPHFSRALTLLVTEPIQAVIEVLHDGYRICDRAGHALARLHLEPLTAISNFLAGDLSLAARIVERTLERNSDWDNGGIALPTVTGLGAYLAMVDGDTNRAAEMADRAVQELLIGGSQAGTSDFAVWCIAAVKESQGKHDEARDMLVFVWELIAKQASLLTIAPDLVRLTAHQRPDFAAEVVSIASTRADLSGSPMDRSNSLAARGYLEKNPVLLEEAADCIEHLGWRLQAAKLRTRALVFRANDSGEELQERVLVLHKEWNAMDARYEISQLEAAHPQFFSSGSGYLTLGGSSPPVSGLAALSQAEQGVVRLLAEGMSNREIAERLYISHRTVESHVSHSLAKLKLTSRLQLASLVTP